MIFEGFPVAPIDANCYIIGCENTKEAAVIDPGGEGKRILKRLQSLGVNCKYIILTHGHADHISALEEVRQATGAQVLIHKDDGIMLTDPNHNLSAMLGMILNFKAADRLLEEGDTIEIGDSISMEVIHTPGHSLGGITLKVGDNLLITGDTLFAGSVGRSDFPGGNHRVLINSIKTKLLSFPDTTQVCSGHGPITTVGREMRYNPFL